MDIALGGEDLSRSGQLSSGGVVRVRDHAHLSEWNYGMQALISDIFQITNNFTYYIIVSFMTEISSLSSNEVS